MNAGREKLRQGPSCLHLFVSHYWRLPSLYIDRQATSSQPQVHLSAAATTIDVGALLSCFIISSLVLPPRMTLSVFLWELAFECAVEIWTGLIFKHHDTKVCQLCCKPVTALYPALKGSSGHQAVGLVRQKVEVNEDRQRPTLFYRAVGEFLSGLLVPKNAACLLRT